MAVSTNILSSAPSYLTPASSKDISPMFITTSSSAASGDDTHDQAIRQADLHAYLRRGISTIKEMLQGSRSDASRQQAWKMPISFSALHPNFGRNTC
ncbi:MAG: hypothetical protein OCU16_07780 [Candidatus Methanospirare jalkutatii]|nr:hypothetical protein [Candidatus Methanospirare jalkutatii]